MINKFGWQEKHLSLFFSPFFNFNLYKLIIRSLKSVQTLLYDLSKISKHDYTNLWVITNRFVKEGLEYEFSGARFLIRIEEKGDVVKTRGGFKTSERGRHCASPRAIDHALAFENGERARRSSRNLRRNAKIVSQFVSRPEPSGSSWVHMLSTVHKI